MCVCAYFWCEKSFFFGFCVFWSFLWFFSIFGFLVLSFFGFFGFFRVFYVFFSFKIDFLILSHSVSLCCVCSYSCNYSCKCHFLLLLPSSSSFLQSGKKVVV